MKKRMKSLAEARAIIAAENARKKADAEMKRKEQEKRAEKRAEEEFKALKKNLKLGWMPPNANGRRRTKFILVLMVGSTESWTVGSVMTSLRR